MMQESLNLLVREKGGVAEQRLNRTIGRSVHLFDDESLPSFIARVAFASHHDDPAWLCGRVGVKSGFGGLWSEAQIKEFALLTGLPLSDVCKRAYQKTKRGYQFLKSTVSRSHFQWSSFKICPHCLAEQGYQSAVFDLHSLRHCPRHAVRLMSHCQGCAAKVEFRGANLFFCRTCKADYRSMKADAVEPSDLGCEADIALRAGFQNVHPAIDRQSLRTCTALEALSLGEFLSMLQTLGAEVPALKLGSRGMDVRPINDEGYRAVREGWLITRRWPDAFFDELDWITDRKAKGDGLAYGVPQTFGGLHRAIVNDNGRRLRELRRAFEIYLRDHWRGVAPSSRSNARLEIAQPSLFSQLESSHEIERRKRMSRSHLAAIQRTRLVKQVSVPPRSGFGKATSVYMDRASLDAAIPAGDKLVSLKEASAALGLSSSLAKRLVEDGVLPLLDGPLVTGAKRYFILDSAVRALVTKLTSGNRRAIGDHLTR